MAKKFTRVKEDFTCAKCGLVVHGTGFTNHCPRCLWSKHVDINPGDRAAKCGGLMAPVSVEQKKGGWRIQHRCQTCGYKKINKISPQDDFDQVIKLSIKV